MDEPLLATTADPNTEGQPTAGGTDDLSSADPAEQPGQTDQDADAGESGETPPEGAPDKYTFENPEALAEGLEIDTEITDAYAEAARELNLPQDKAQAMYAKTMTAMHARARAVQEQQAGEWVAAVKADPDIGGTNFDRNQGIARKAIDEFASDELREVLNDPVGIGNHPEMVRFMVKVGRTLSEDSFGKGDGPDGGDGGETSEAGEEAARAKRMYPTSLK